MNKNRLLNTLNTSFVIEAHSPISAKIAQKIGFDGVWISSFALSSLYGLRDCNELSFSQVLDNVTFINDVIDIPILVDGDNGYGSCNNFRNFVKKLCKIGASAVCIEDKVFPKMNSFFQNNHVLVSIEDFCNKIKAGKDGQTTSNFFIIARTEALIAGYDINIAFERINMYHEAGADAILVHSKSNSATEIIKFLEMWNNRCPVVLIPTTYSGIDNNLFLKYKIAIVIWANHLIRASIKHMYEISENIFVNKSVQKIENKISNLNEIFDMLNYEELIDLKK